MGRPALGHMFRCAPSRLALALLAAVSGCWAARAPRSDLVTRLKGSMPFPVLYDDDGSFQTFTSDHTWQAIKVTSSGGVSLSGFTWNLMNKGHDQANCQHPSPAGDLYSNNPFNLQESDDAYIARKRQQLDYLKTLLLSKERGFSFAFLQEPDLILFPHDEAAKNMTRDWLLDLVNHGWVHVRTEREMGKIKPQMILYDSNILTLRYGSERGILPMDKLSGLAADFFLYTSETGSPLEITLASLHLDYTRVYERDIIDFQMNQIRNGKLTIMGGDTNKPLTDPSGRENLKYATNFDRCKHDTDAITLVHSDGFFVSPRNPHEKVWIEELPGTFFHVTLWNDLAVSELSPSDVHGGESYVHESLLGLPWIRSRALIGSVTSKRRLPEGAGEFQFKQPASTEDAELEDSVESWRFRFAQKHKAELEKERAAFEAERSELRAALERQQNESQRAAAELTAELERQQTETRRAAEELKRLEREHGRQLAARERSEAERFAARLAEEQAELEAKLAQAAAELKHKSNETRGLEKELGSIESDYKKKEKDRNGKWQEIRRLEGEQRKRLEARVHEAAAETKRVEIRALRFEAEAEELNRSLAALGRGFEAERKQRREEERRHALEVEAQERRHEEERVKQEKKHRFAMDQKSRAYKSQLGNATAQIEHQLRALEEQSRILALQQQKIEALEKNQLTVCGVGVVASAAALMMRFRK